MVVGTANMLWEQGNLTVTVTSLTVVSPAARQPQAVLNTVEATSLCGTLYENFNAGELYEN